MRRDFWRLLHILAAMLMMTLSSFAAKKGSRFSRGTIADQRAALEAIYDATGGDQWRNNRGWKDSDDLDSWYGITCNSFGSVTKINLRSNSLKGELPDVFDAFPDCVSINFSNSYKEKESDNHLTGQLPETMLTFVGKTNFNLRWNHFTQTEFYLPNERLLAANSSLLVYPQRNEDFRMHLNSINDLKAKKVRGDRTVFLRQKATKGKGIDIFIVGDGYDAANHSVDGLVDFWYEQAYDALFSVDPMNKLRKYYNVWYVYGHSEERGIGLFESKRKSIYGYQQKDPLHKSQCSFRAQSIANVIEDAFAKEKRDFTSKSAYVLMVVNSTNRGLYLGMMYSRRVVINGEKKVFRLGVVPTRAGAFEPLIHHELVGHAIGKLHDEYGDEKSKLHKDPVGKKHRFGPNIDCESDPTKAKWAQFYLDPRYKNEKLGCYQGALSCSNLYRATYKSYMNGGKRRIRWFNAPSRASIYTQTMQQAYDEWEFDYETFVKFDMKKKSQRMMK